MPARRIVQVANVGIGPGHPTLSPAFPDKMGRTEGEGHGDCYGKEKKRGEQ